MEDTDVPELQPEYIQGMLDETVDEIGNAAQEILVNPDNAGPVLDELTSNIESRINELADAADKDAITSAVASNTDLTEEEAEQAVDNIYNGLVAASEEASAQLESASVAIEEARVSIASTVDTATDQVAETADQATDSASSGAIWTFIALLLGMILSSLGGIVGSNKVRHTVMEE